MEIEAKFAVASPVSPDQISALNLSPYHLEDRGVERHDDVVLDTPARGLNSARQALRIRRTPDATLMTLKGPTRREGAVFTRDEIEDEIEAPAATDAEIAADPTCWPPAIAARVLPLLDGAPLEPLVRVAVARHLWHVTRDGALVAEIALDEGSIGAGGRELALRELEVEIKATGTRDDLDTLTTMLRADLPLLPEPLTKVRRGLALLDGRNPAGLMPVVELGRDALAAQVRIIHLNEAGARAGDDPDAIHDLRVAVRRTRALLAVLAAAPGFKRKPLENLRARLKSLAGRLGAVRDGDVLLARCSDYSSHQPDLAGDLAPLRDELLRRRARAQRKLTRELDSDVYASVRDDLESLVAGEYGAAREKGEPLTIAAFAGSALWRRYERVLSRDEAVGAGDRRRLHRLRVECKHLRYTLELFAPRLDARVGSLIAQLKRAQDDLGELHDATVAAALVARLAARHPDARGLADYGAALDAEADERIAAFVPLWRALSSQDFREPLAAIIGAL